MMTQTRTPKPIDALLPLLSSMTGPLDAKYIKIIQRVYKNPTEKNWDRAACVIVGGKAYFHTLWQAWIATDAFAPRTGGRTDFNGNILQRWDRIPTQDELYEALAYAAAANVDRGTLKLKEVNLYGEQDGIVIYLNADHDICDNQDATVRVIGHDLYVCPIEVARQKIRSAYLDRVGIADPTSFDQQWGK
jgi:hypothetical protein